ncbi:PREDICTED: D-3-phosphoglycerate dehydrogenase 1, chloroplastic-like [Camelina sativa]|uniref:D-3-phosphoglycerate dehydrogenase 1, chloroplastic-like n=1 Tax=Camelina sativa TaxID=90675 RepID=A0ABM0V5J3_CAMSA|nr:PREDICTED: D-3-phosphoglycerate dehydrogenase 1, chloroplastic-like [Camelina sativa]
MPSAVAACFSISVATNNPNTILVAEKICEASVKLLEDFANVDRSYNMTRLNMTPEELNTKVSLCNASIVHSETKVGRDVFESSRGRLRTLGRTGTCNVDLSAATDFGCLFVNAPRPNTIAAAEHATALMPSMAQADAVSSV